MYPYTIYQFRVRQKPTPDCPNPPRKVHTTRHRMTEKEAQEQYEVIERIDSSAMLITGPAEPTSTVLNKGQRWEGKSPPRWSLQSDDIPEIDFDL